MANTFSSTYTSPDHVAITPGDDILAAETQDIIEASNFIHALGASRICQAWNTADDIFRRAGGAFATNCHWRMPALGVRTTVRCLAYVECAGLLSAIRFKSVNTGNTVTIPVPAGAASWVEGNLTCSFGPGYDEIELATHGNGADEVKVHTAQTVFPPLTSPLSAPASTDNVTPFDENEQAADMPLAADTGRDLRANIVEFLDRPRQHMSYSGLDNVDSGAVASATMPSHEHGWYAQTFLGNIARQIKAEIHAYAANSSGVNDQYVVVFAPGAPDGPVRITVPAAAAAAAWYAPDSAPPDDEGTQRYLPEDMSLFPTTGCAFAKLSATPGFPGEIWSADADLYSISIWGP